MTKSRNSNTYVDESGKFYYGHEDGSWSAGVPPHASSDLLTGFLRIPVTDWSLLGTDQADGRSAYVIERLGNYIGGGEYLETYWIDAETFLPIKQVSKNAAQEQTQGTTEFQTQFSDFGAPVDVEVPPEALAPTPTPTPPEPANPLTSNDPTAIAEGFMQAFIAGDFETVQAYYAPDRRPDTWAEIFDFDFVTANTVECSGVAYETVARQGVFAGVDFAEITLVFESDCIEQMYASGGSRGVWSNEAFVSLEGGTGYWYVQALSFPW